MITSTPWATRPLITRPMAFSLPGMAREEKITRSPRVERDLGMLVLGDARQGRARLALAAGAQGQDLVGRQVAVALGAAKILHAVEIAGLARHLGHPLHGAADQDDLAVGGASGVGHGADAADVGRKCRDSHAGGRGADEFRDGLGDVGLGGRAAVTDGIGRIANEREHAFVAERGEPRRIG